ncbi:MAG: glycine/sarcosine/betaine reductase selenoprotein B family protein [SAR324 cluster bacterium]|jgi:hypothetical protein|nr:glycine/sarcosine/betaine reductase selenoprotein B family protein [SAR324 cluster bacterium]|tara:strand:+ start:564 stop:1070 length:507 start_codon:yes stop_codon:yes gene_type:complete
MPERRSHRSFMSYIDKSREYYAAHGYDQPYQWPYHHEVPFVTLSKPLSECTVGVVSTASLPSRAEQVAASFRPPKHPYAISANPIPESLYTQDVAWDKEATHTDDINTYLPLQRLQEFQQQGRIGKNSRRFYGAATTYSQRQTLETDAPEILAWCREDEVDVVLLVPL